MDHPLEWVIECNLTQTQQWGPVLESWWVIEWYTGADQLALGLYKSVDAYHQGRLIFEEADKCVFEDTAIQAAEDCGVFSVMHPRSFLQCLARLRELRDRDMWHGYRFHCVTTDEYISASFL